MRILTLLLALSLCVVPLAEAQKGSVEVGTRAGVSLAIPDDGDTEVFVAIPGTGALFLLPTIYATFWAAPALMIEPQVSFSWNSATEDVWFSGVLQGGWMFSPQKRNSVYVAADLGWLTLGDFDSALAGGGAGYRFRAGDVVALRVEGLYRRWLCSGCDLNEVIFSFGAGAVF